jgi:hypothetical protein
MSDGSSRSDFSIGDAVGSGFELIARRPLSVLAWAAVYLVLVVIPALAHFAAIRPVWTTMIHAWMERLRDGGAPDFSEIQSYNMQMADAGGLMWLTLLGALAAWAILSAAVYRSELEPENKRFASLRLGAQELWLALLFLVLTILLAIAYVVIIIAAVVLSVLVGFAGHAVSQPAGGLVAGLLIFLICIGALAAFFWICVRFSLAGPLTFKERQFRLFESWTMTRGHAWKLFGLALLITLIVIALSLVVAALSGAVFFGVVGANGFDPTRLAEIYASGGWWRSFSPWLVAAAVVRSLIGAAFLAIMVAPWATAFRELGGGLKREHPPVF